MPYPRFKREEKLCSKLSDEDIKKAKSLRKQGCSYKEIGRVFNVAGTTIWFAILPEDEQKRRRKKYWANRKGHADLTMSNLASKNARDRKRVEKEKEFKQYLKEKSAKFFKNHPGYNKEYLKEFRKKYPDYYKKYGRK